MTISWHGKAPPGYDFRKRADETCLEHFTRILKATYLGPPEVEADKREIPTVTPSVTGEH